MVFVFSLVTSTSWGADLENAISPYVPQKLFNFWEYDSLPRKEVLYNRCGQFNTW